MITSKKLTPERIEEIKKFPIVFDEDSPKLSVAQIERLRPRLFSVKPIKKAISIKIDADVLEALKSSGKGYQTRINSILRQVVLHE